MIFEDPLIHVKIFKDPLQFRQRGVPLNNERSLRFKKIFDPLIVHDKIRWTPPPVETLKFLFSKEIWPSFAFLSLIKLKVNFGGIR